MSALIIPTWQTEEFSTKIELLSQQRESRFRGKMTERTYVGKQVSPIDQVAKISMSEVTTRFETIVRTDAATDRRWVSPRDFDLAQQVDKFDKFRVMNDPESSLMQTALAAVGRQIDDVVIPAFFGAAMTGEQGATSTTEPSGQVIAVDFASAAAIGLTAKKIIEVRRLFGLNEVNLDTDQIYIAIDAFQNAQLLNDYLVISQDFNPSFNPGRPVQDGKGRVMQWLGCEFVHSERLQSTADPYLRVPAWCYSGMHFAMWGIMTKVSERNDLRGYPWQLYNMLTCNATRLEEVKVEEILCKKT